MSEAARIIERLNLAPHPEGGWYRETWRASAPEGERPSGTAIHYLLDMGQSSHWHRVDATEIWLWHAGSALAMRTAPSDQGPVERILLGPDLGAGEQPQLVIPAHHWQAAHANNGWALVSCVVSPGFEFQGFEMADAGWEPGSDQERQNSGI